MQHLDSLEKLNQLRSDLGRHERTGVAEVVFAEHKTPEQVVAAVSQLIIASGKALVSRVTPEVLERLRKLDCTFETSPGGRTVVLRSVLNKSEPPCLGRVGVLAAGSSDIEAAEEARMLCVESGCEVETAYDVGVAGIHRLIEPLRQMTSTQRCGVLIVAAGMDGALPSVVAGLVDLPVIGLPTSVGYGLGGKGIGALTSMLQACAPGIAVVNIDNGIGAGALAVKILRQIAAAKGAA